MHWCLHSENSCSSLGEGPKCCELTCSCGNSKCKSCHAEKLHHGLLQHTGGLRVSKTHFFSSSLRINLVCESSALKQKSSRQGRVKADTRCFSCASAHTGNGHGRVWKQDARTGLRSLAAGSTHCLHLVRSYSICSLEFQAEQVIPWLV